MKKIYIIVSHTGTVLSRIIQCYTRDEYSHVSIALDKDLEEMYSFGRLNPYNPFYGGFVHERVNEGTFKRFKNTRSCVYSLEVEEYQYRKIKKIIQRFAYHRKAYKFNVLGLFAVGFKIKIRHGQYKNHGTDRKQAVISIIKHFHILKYIETQKFDGNYQT